MNEAEGTKSREGFEVGSPDLRSTGPITFSPDGILFVADNLQAQIVAIDLSCDSAKTAHADVETLDERLAALLGCAAGDIAIRDLAVHPLSQAVYLSLMRGVGDSALPVMIRIGGDGGLSVVELDSVSYARATIDDAPLADDEREDMRAVADGNAEGEAMELPSLGLTVWVARDRLRSTTVTDLAFLDGELMVAGASNEEFASAFRRIPFPFRDGPQTTTLEVFHVSHGRYETHSPIRTFVPYGGGILASYTCTPVVHFPLADLVGGTRAVGRTVADLGALSSPIDIVSFTRGGDEYALVSNSRHPLMKIACRDIDAQDGLTRPKEPVGVPRQELPHRGVSRMAVTDRHVLMLQRDDAGLHLRSYSSSSL
jgi:hypothetical protein